ncbi:MAG: hypothetical protein EZS28_045061, partial [Streblomastix strix]
ETDELLTENADKKDTIDAYSKQQTDQLLDEEVNESSLDNYYIAGQIDQFLDENANIDDVFTKEESFNMVERGKEDATNKIEDKADRLELSQYVDLQSAQTINGAKQFGIISATTISKLTKNNTSILLAGGGDMLVSSLINQPQLLEVGDIATGRSGRYAFDTLQVMNNWMAIPENDTNQAVGDNLYKVDTQITDYWWDDTQLRELEILIPDLTKVETTLGTASRRGNAITDLNIIRNILTPAKNKNFVDIKYEQAITGQKTIIVTIHSHGITYLNYDNSSEILDSRGVRSIADIQSASFTKAQDDALQ